MKGKKEGKFIAKYGYVLDSEFEREVDNGLFENSYPHEIHPKYLGSRRSVVDLRALRTDAYLEAVGMEDAKEYKEELERKRNYTNGRETELIEIVPAVLET